MTSAILGSEDRVKKSSGQGREVRGATEDVRERELEHGTAFTDEERRRMLKNLDWVQEALPNPPSIPGYHCVWLSTNHQSDAIHNRVRMGYAPVRAEEVPGFEHLKMKSGQYEGVISVNEMVLFKIPDEIYQLIMERYHHDAPNEEEQGIREQSQFGQRDSSGKTLGIEEGDGFSSLGASRGRRPTF